MLGGLLVFELRQHAIAGVLIAPNSEVGWLKERSALVGIEIFNLDDLTAYRHGEIRKNRDVADEHPCRGRHIEQFQPDTTLAEVGSNDAACGAVAQFVFSLA